MIGASIPVGLHLAMRTGISLRAVPLGSWANAAAHSGWVYFRLQIGWRQNHDRFFSPGSGPLHVEDKVASGPEIPGLNDHREPTSSSVQAIHSAQGWIRFGIADEKVFHDGISSKD